MWRDIAYPLGETLQDFVTPKDNIAVLKTSLINMLLTNPGERVMRPVFGAGIHSFLFDPNDMGAASSIENNIRETIARYDDRILVEYVKATKTEDDELTVVVAFRDADDPLSRQLSELRFTLTDMNVVIE